MHAYLQIYDLWLLGLNLDQDTDPWLIILLGDTLRKGMTEGFLDWRIILK